MVTKRNAKKRYDAGLAAALEIYIYGAALEAYCPAVVPCAHAPMQAVAPCTHAGFGRWQHAQPSDAADDAPVSAAMIEGGGEQGNE